ncbi:Urease operon accessory protein [Ancylobacter sp. Lp-2]|uniref:Urease operon accessory protein n=1 Tax=Ancylobacter sp. Lp-2 TaxID=2881339 RepID=UPI001E528DD8|nr:Urease operon accessory protein [Ancylobacter sp. Lp-2]MCB4769725.1 Urease operon accessory protein [Ancylobacter sp. Lp-2]
MCGGILLVGNGSVDPLALSRLDDFDLVVRFNDCRNFASAPGRTDVVAVCNTGRPARQMSAATAWRRHPAVVAAREIWSVRPPRLFAAARPRIVADHPELADLCDDYTAAFVAFCRATGKRHLTVDEEVHRAAATALAPLAPDSYVTPSSGLIVIEHLLRRRRAARIVLAGFDHAGWSGHPFAAEARLVDSYVRQGLMSRLEPVARGAA